MASRSAEATWTGTLKEGQGNLKLASDAFDGPFSFSTRFEDGVTGTNPEEMIAAALAGCFTMQIGATMERNGTPVTRLHTTANLKMERVNEKLTITRIELVTEGEIPGVDEAKYLEVVKEAEQDCIITRALGGVEIVVTSATLKS
ncbi:MAG: OsmC family peroxiredoxin [Anaerolineae bacterium]|nr:OsmC family peroxiredoxin [Anaerolineae bacterium]